jgi:hypothetical protein
MTAHNKALTLTITDHNKALTVQCELCGAHPGERARTSCAAVGSRHVPTPHLIRVWDAREHGRGAQR